MYVYENKQKNVFIYVLFSFFFKNVFKNYGYSFILTNKDSLQKKCKTNRIKYSQK